ncbi:hypothetical protein [Chelatococcus asaccharovorans]|uniref:Uncharacterized protein n=1 Tax=Chelatococcus asaccharovorans TaxID=28210 RepID=A0A2V3U3H5_9HYPH|nr:hypothetical protein [Chelatococcus asaccharovorans]MBS7702805.1 hypothetical protein [Chelatococcus asaccharovorans]PXW57097.1 hypothetical protein C7450_107135 [Chelatococcus asaccharovorans]
MSKSDGLVAIGLVGHNGMVIPQKLGLAGGCRVLGGFAEATTPAGLEKWGADRTAL